MGDRKSYGYIIRCTLGGDITDAAVLLYNMTSRDMR